MKNFLIFLSIIVVVVLAASDLKGRMAELDEISKSQNTNVEFRINEQNPSEINIEYDSTNKKTHR